MKKEKEPLVRKMTDISEADVSVIALGRHLVKFPKPLNYLLASVAAGCFATAVAAALGHMVLALSIIIITGLLILYTLLLELLLEMKARKTFIQHWEETGELYPDDWRYDLKLKEFRAPERKEAAGGTDGE